ncbi:MAG: TetR family transcriptional regulator [Blastocatellia bacterium]|nr:TetR family transcriptional regulator [Blastocatellia bacterium]
MRWQYRSDRARNTEHKLERREALLAAARELWDMGTYESTTMAGIGQRAGVSKATVYLYFDTKEQLLLEILREKLESWFSAIDAALDASFGSWSSDRAAREIALSFEGRRSLVRLLSALEAVIEYNVDVDTLRVFKRWLAGRMTATGQRLERRITFLRPGDGVRILVQMRAFLLGLAVMTSPSPAVERVIADDRTLSMFALDFDREFTDGLRTLLRGYEAGGAAT